MEINSRRKNSLVDEDGDDLALFLLFLIDPSHTWHITAPGHFS